MPIPLSPGMYLAQVVMRPDSIPSSNSFVNTFFFNDSAYPRLIADVADDIEALLEDFYNTANGGAPTTIAAGLSAVINPALTTVRVYDLGEPVPRVPEIRGMGSWTLSTTALPNECAVVLSYISGPTSVTGGTIDKTRRGRVFIGPLGENVASLVAGDQDATVDSSFVLAMVGAAEMLLAGAGTMSWMQYSRKEDRFEGVSGGFVNDRFDTQRRRGAESTSRSVW